MQIQCDICKAQVKEVLPEQIRDGDIEHTFFRCPTCGAVYPVCATDTPLREDIRQYDAMRQKVRVSVVTEQFLRNAEALKQQNLKRTQELMVEHPLALFLQSSAAE